MHAASVAGQRASFASGRLLQSMYQDNMLVKHQIELVRYNENAPLNLTGLWIREAGGVKGHAPGRAK